MRYFLVSVFVLFVLLGSVSVEVLAQNTFSLSGKVVENNSDKPIGFTTVVLKEINKWSVTNVGGAFYIDKINRGTYTLVVSCLGYQTIEKEIKIDKDLIDYDIDLNVLSLGLKEVLVTAKQNEDNITTAYDINSEAIEHAQITNISEIMSLLPGGQTSLGNLVKSSGSRITIRSVKGEEDNPSFGTAIEVDGIRLSNNAEFIEEDIDGTSKIKGIDPRIISPENIAEVKVISGISSVEHGDLTSGLVKIITKQGVMPLSLRFSSSPRQKQASLFKGIRLGKNAGVLNISYDYTKSILNIASPYESYKRNAFTFRHKKVFFDNTGKPLTLSSTLAGNVGGYNTKADPDGFKDTYKKKKAFNIRSGVNVAWRLNSKLISELDFSASINYSDKKYEEYTKESSASGTIAFHGTEEGYFVGQVYKEGEAFSAIQLNDRGYWYQTTYVDAKPINYGVKLKLQKNNKSEKRSNQFKLGADFTGSGNKGRGLYYGNTAHTPTWREHRYDQEPYLNNLALFAEESFKYYFNKGQYLHFVGGIRNDYTFVKDSKYENVSALSPRFNIEYNIIDIPSNKYLKKLSCYAGWGKSVKLPSFNMLYIRPTYRQKMAFVPGSLADGTTYYAYHIQPYEVLDNKSLRWQKSRKLEVGVRGQVKGMRFSLSYFNTLGKNNYTTSYEYTPFTYYLTTPYQLTEVSIPYENRNYTIDQTGTVTVHDNTGVLPDEVLDKKEKRSFKKASYADNGSPIKRHGVEWVLDFGELKVLHTSLRIDGKYYFYKHLNKKITAESFGSQLMADGSNYQYIGYYYGGDAIANGKITRSLSANATFVTHIPKLRLIVSLKIEGTFIDTEQKLSEMPSGERAFEFNEEERYIPKSGGGSIYEGNNLVAMYPLYYTTFDDMETKIPFREKYLWAYKNDKTLFNNLSKMVVASSKDYYFKKQGKTAYFTANINISKEIGGHFKFTFFAKNFLNNMAKVKQIENDVEKSLLNSGIITPFSYGMSLKIKL